MLVIRAGRRLVHGTPVQRWRFTDYLYRRIFRMGWAGESTRTVFRGLDLVVPNKDVTIVPGILGGFYEARELDLWERLTPVSGLVVDVGGNLGVYACLAAKAQGTRVVVFEPAPENVDLLRKNLALNGVLDRVELVEAAVGDVQGELVIHLAKENIGTHSASRANAGAGADASSSVRVPVWTLDEHPATAPTRPSLETACLLKVDVEGYDGHVLRGARAFIEKVKPTLLIEYVPQHLRGCQFSPEEFLDIVFAAYTTVYAVTGTGGAVMQVEREAVSVDASANLVAVHDDVHRRIVEAWARASARNA